MKYGLLILLAVAIAALTGCGGSNDQTTSGLEDTVRQIQSGDEYKYTVTGQRTDPDGTLDVAGEYALIVTGQVITTPQDVEATVLLETFDLTANGHAVKNLAYRQYITQNAYGTIYQHGGQTEENYWVTTPAIGCYQSMPSPLSIGATWSENIVTVPTGNYTQTYVVTGTDTASLTTGFYQVYRITFSGCWLTLPAHGELLYAPQIGGFVSGNIIATEYVPPMLDDEGEVIEEEYTITYNINLTLQSISR